MSDFITNRGFIHNCYKDSYGKDYRIVESSTTGVFIFGDYIVDKSGTIFLKNQKEIKKFYKELKRIAKGKKVL